MDLESVTDTYVLPRDESELHRLNLQYAYLKTLVTDGRLIYDKKVEILPGARVWALEAAEHLASAQVYAVDLSSNNFPPSPPPHAHFSLASVTDLPHDWTETVDLVNQRLLFGALLREQWPKNLSEIYRVLKPGGVVQLVEIDLYHPVPESPVVSYYAEIHQKSAEHAGLMANASTMLHDMLLRAGFVGVKSESKHTPVGKMWGEIGAQGKEVTGGALGKLAKMFMNAGYVGSKEEYDGLMDKLKQEWDEQGTQYHCVVACARKPFV